MPRNLELEACVINHAYQANAIGLLPGALILAGKHGKTNVGVVIKQGTFCRADYKAAMNECITHGLKVGKVYAYADCCTYSGPGIQFVKLEDLGIANLDRFLDLETKVAHVGELLIRAAAVVGQLTDLQKEKLANSAGSGLVDALVAAIKAASQVAPTLAMSLKTHPPVGFEEYLAEPEVLDDTLRRMGFVLTSTGGGCEAWDLASGKYFIFLTSNDGMTARGLTEKDQLFLGYYEVGQEHNDYLQMWEGSWEGVKPLIDQFKIGQWQPPTV